MDGEFHISCFKDFTFASFFTFFFALIAKFRAFRLISLHFFSEARFHLQLTLSVVHPVFHVFFRRTQSLHGPSPVTTFGPKACMLQNPQAVMWVYFVTLHFKNDRCDFLWNSLVCFWGFFFHLFVWVSTQMGGWVSEWGFKCSSA